jgi:hypothetical protein
MEADSYVVPDPAVMRRELAARAHVYMQKDSLLPLARVELMKVICGDIKQAHALGMTDVKWNVRCIQAVLSRAISERAPKLLPANMVTYFEMLITAKWIVACLTDELQTKYADYKIDAYRTHAEFCDCVDGTQGCQEVIWVSWK